VDTTNGPTDEAPPQRWAGVCIVEGPRVFGPFDEEANAILWVIDHDELEHGGTEEGFGVFHVKLERTAGTAS